MNGPIKRAQGQIARVGRATQTALVHWPLEQSEPCAHGAPRAPRATHLRVMGSQRAYDKQPVMLLATQSAPGAPRGTHLFVVGSQKSLPASQAPSVL